MADRFGLDGKVALITGASSGFGAHFAKVLSEAGAQVILAARRMDQLEALAEDIRAAGGKALPVSMDVTDTSSVESALKQSGQEMGVADIVINNSGLSREDWFINMDEDAFDLVMDTNLKGVWRVARTAAQAMIAAGKPGSIVNIASITAFRASQMIGAYATSKAGVDHMTRALALELARFNIRVNAIAPGYFRTEINTDFLDSDYGNGMLKRIAMRRTGEMEDISGPLLLLASDAGAFMTGSTLVVDGGHLLAPL